MRNYIILNGNNSNEIAGLLIQTLPPISQPKIRTNIEEIDGRDGDIITKLGYSAYNKEISIGLYGNYNVDDIIKYFTDNQSGKVTFSNEEDKYYNYEILEQIDFERLIRYKTATVTLHCQPFKYSTTEEKIQINATEVSGTGSNITLNNTEDGALFTSLQINGDTLQDGTPTPSNPVNVNVVSGNNTINIRGKNLVGIFNTGSSTLNGVTITSNANGSITFNGTSTGYIYGYISKYTGIIDNQNATDGLTVKTPTNSTVTLSGSGTNVKLRLRNNTDGTNDSTGNITKTYTSSKELTIMFYIQSGVTINETIYPQLEYGSTATSFKKYQSQTYPINLGKNLVPTGQVFNGNTNQWYDQFGNVMGTLENIQASNNYIDLNPNTTYSFFLQEYNNISTLQIIYINSSDNVTTYVNTTSLTSTITFTTTTYTRIYIRVKATGNSANTYFISQLEKGTQATSYAPYFEPIELCKIGDYQDYIYKANGNWYKYGAIGKVELSSNTQDWYIASTDTNTYRMVNVALLANTNPLGTATNLFLNNYFAEYDGNSGIASIDSEGIAIRNGLDGFTIRILKTRVSSLADFKNWLSSNNVTAYYVLATPTITQITDTTLISQLEALASATTYLGQTNIMTSGSDLAPLLDVTTYAVENPSFTITNNGNIYSKPIITIYGLGTIGLYLNGSQVLSLDMGETTSQITIDVAKMEAYNQETGALMNRSVTGDYNNLSLNVGANIITESGTLQGIEVEKYSRWL